jgi:hypothetical protein
MVWVFPLSEKVSHKKVSTTTMLSTTSSGATNEWLEPVSDEQYNANIR